MSDYAVYTLQARWRPGSGLVVRPPESNHWHAVRESPLGITELDTPKEGGFTAVAYENHPFTHQVHLWALWTKSGVVHQFRATFDLEQLLDGLDIKILEVRPFPGKLPYFGESSKTVAPTQSLRRKLLLLAAR